MRTYSHALLTWAAAKRLKPSGPDIAAFSMAGALLPDVSVGVGAVWLGAQRLGRFSREEFDAEVCGKTLFSRPDAGLHSLLPVAALLALYAAPAVRQLDPERTLLAFLLGWAGHAIADALTHAGDARPIVWPISGWRLEAPISYWDRDRHALLFTFAEHTALLAASTWLLQRGRSST